MTTHAFTGIEPKLLKYPHVLIKKHSHYFF
jgi:hypothetical protein